MAHLLCSNCCQKFDDENSYTVLEITVPGFLTKSHLKEALSFRRPVCPRCGAAEALLSMEAMSSKSTKASRWAQA